MSPPEPVRRRILDASVALVAEHGVRAVSFREVARRAGVSHQTPYHHFGNHLGILHAIAREGFAGLTAAMTTAAARARDPVEGLRAAGVAYVEFACAHVGHFRVMFQRALVDAQAGGPPMAEAGETHATLVRLCTEARAAGGGGGLSLDDLTHLAWSTVHGLATLEIEGALRDPSGRSSPAARRVLAGLSRLLERPSKPPKRR